MVERFANLCEEQGSYSWPRKGSLGVRNVEGRDPRTTQPNGARYDQGRNEADSATSQPYCGGVPAIPAGIGRAIANDRFSLRLFWAPEANPATGKLSSCSVLGAEFVYPATPSGTCYDQDGDPAGPLYNDYPTFSNDDFEYYNASTGKTTDVKWSWTNGSNDLSTAYSACTGYYDCDDDYNVFYQEGYGSGQGAAFITATTTIEQGENDGSFWWHFNDWSTQLSECDPGCDDGLYENPVAVDVGGNDATFYFSWDCAVTS